MFREKFNGSCFSGCSLESTARVIRLDGLCAAILADIVIPFYSEKLNNFVIDFL